MIYYEPYMPAYCTIDYAPRAAYAPPMHYEQRQSAPPSYAPRTSPARAATSVTVAAYDNYFEPKTVNIQPGTTVRWVNRGKHAHTVTANDERWDSGDIQPGAVYSATFQKAGSYYYYCRHHTRDKMQGVIVVANGGAAKNTAGQAAPRGASAAQAY
jgi:plastocyanin